jgi:hypothetical protein
VGKRIKTGNKGHRGLLFFIIVVGLVVGLWVWRKGYFATKLWGQGRYNVVFNYSSPVLVSVDANSQDMTVIVLPGDLYLPVSGDYGRYLLKNVYPLGELEKSGKRLLLETISQAVGVPFSAIVTLDKTTGWQNIWEWLPKIKNTDLSLVDLILVSKAMTFVRYDKVKTLTVSKENGLASDLVMGDGSTALEMNYDAFDQATTGRFVYPEVLRGGELRVAVLNAGEVTGLGSKMSRMLSGMGFNPVSISDTISPISGCEVVAGTKSLSSGSVGLVAKIFGCSLKEGNDPRVDFTIILRSLRLSVN